MTFFFDPSRTWNESPSIINYFSAAHLAFAGQTDAAVAMLKRAVEGGYCFYPASYTDPLLRSIRSNTKFAEIRLAAIECQNKFLAERTQVQ